MEFEDIVVKESPGLCRCCLSEGCYKDMGSEYTWMNETEVYADMLLECFDISISQHNDGPNGASRLICEVCITRLRDACNFKKQVLDSEKKFVDMVGRGEFRPKVLIYQAELKPEGNVEETLAEEGDVEYLEEDLDFGDAEELLKNEQTDLEISTEQATASDSITVTTLPVKGKRGRPRKHPVVAKPEKRAKLDKTEEKPRSSKAVTKGDTVAPDEAKNKSSMSATKRNRFMRRNAVIILESSTVVPFKWHRQSYLCFFCHQTFKDMESLKGHTRSEHKKSNIKTAVSYLRRDEKVKVNVSETSCRICDAKLDDLNNLITHFKVVHKISFTEECGYGLIPYKLENEAYQCAICKEDFQYFIKLNQHMNKHFGNYICELCGKSFLSQDRLRSHSLNHGSGFHCNSCSETFDSLTQKNNHESKVHNKDKTLKCFYCEITFPNYSQRKKHHSVVHNVEIPEFNCPVCGKVFQIMSKMQVHLKEVHIREKNFSCSICDHKFFSRTHLRNHMIKHFGERIHQCGICKKSYARKQTLRDHIRIHNNDKRFVCSICSQGFIQNNSLRLHMRVHHPDNTTA